MPPDGIGGTATFTVLRVVCFSVQIGGIGDSGFHSILATDSYSFNQLIANIIILTVICFSVCILYCALCMSYKFQSWHVCLFRDSQRHAGSPIFLNPLLHFGYPLSVLWAPVSAGRRDRREEGRVYPTDVWGNGS